MMSNRTRLLQIVALSMLACAPVTRRGGGSGADAAAVMVNQANPLSSLSKARLILMRGPAGVAALQRQDFQPPHGQSDTQQP